MPAPNIDVTEHYTDLFRAIHHIAERYFFAGRLDDALRVLEGGEYLATEPKVRQAELADVLIHVGQIMGYRSSMITNEHASTLALTRRAVEVAQRTGDRFLIARALDTLGDASYANVLHGREGSFDEVAGYYQEALALRESIRDHRGICESLFHVGLIAERKQDYAEARSIFDRVRMLAEHGDYKHEQAEALRHIGFDYTRAGNLPEALRCFQSSLSLFEDTGFGLVLPFAHLSVGEIYFEQGLLTEAMVHYEAGYALAEDMHIDRATMQIAYSIGELYEAQNEADRAREYYARAYSHAETMRHTYGMELCRAKLHVGTP